MMFIDLFCGIGGFHQALSNIGGECVFACDVDENCRRVYADNYGITPHGDITKIGERNIPPHDVLCAGFPCQPFSKAGNRMGFEDKTKGTLFFDIMRIVRHHKPQYIILENVRNLLGHDDGNTWLTIRESIREQGYYTPDTPLILSPHQLGTPQHRERVYILCSRGKWDYPHHINNKPLRSIDTVLQGDGEIENIEKYLLSSNQIQLIDLWGEFIYCIKGNTPKFPIWTEWLKECDTIPDAPSWKQNLINKNIELYANNRGFMDKWLAKAKSNPLFFGAKAKLEWQKGDAKDIWDSFIQFRPSGIRIKKPDTFPALVAITQTSIVGRQKRFLTPRECARLQGFPDSFRLDANDRQAYKQLGNAVNVDCVGYCIKTLMG